MRDAGCPTRAIFKVKLTSDEGTVCDHSGIKFLKSLRGRVSSNPPFPKEGKDGATLIVVRKGKRQGVAAPLLHFQNQKIKHAAKVSFKSDTTSVPGVSVRTCWPKVRFTPINNVGNARCVLNPLEKICAVPI